MTALDETFAAALDYERVQPPGTRSSLDQIATGLRVSLPDAGVPVNRDTLRAFAAALSLLSERVEAGDPFRDACDALLIAAAKLDETLGDAEVSA